MIKLKYPSLNGLRAISVLMVMLHHLAVKKDLFIPFADNKCLKPFIDFITDGQLGVNVFFVISGFLITSLLLEEENVTGSIEIGNFYKRRFLRILPAYYFLLGIYFLMHILHFYNITLASWITSFTFTKYLNWQLDWGTAHFWSLSVEENFYLFWPFIFIGGQFWRKFTAILLIVIVPFVRWYTFEHEVFWIDKHSIFTRIDAIAMGCLFALYKEIILEKLSKYWYWIFYSSVLFLFGARYFPDLTKSIHLSLVFIPLGTTYGTLANLFIALLMMYSIFGPRLIWFKILNFKVLNFIGLLSYSLYLWQQLFISKATNWCFQFPQNILLTFIMALFSYYMIEKPFLKLKNRYSFWFAKSKQK